MMKRIYITTILAAAMVALASCGDDLGVDTPGDKGENSDKVITLSFSNSSDQAPATRSVPDVRATEPGDDLYNENKIDKIDLFFYDNLGSECLLYVSSEDPNTADYNLTWDENEQKCKIEFLNGSEETIMLKNVDIYMIANSPTTFDPADFGGQTGKNITELGGMLVTSELNPDPAAAQSSFLMTGRLFAYIAGFSELGNIELRRAASKVTVAIGNAQVTDGSGTLTHTAKSASASLVGYLDKSNLNPATPYSPAVSDFKTSIGHDLPVTGGEKCMPLYTYEFSWEGNMEREPSLLIAVDWEPVASPGTTDTRYYKVPFNYLQLGEGQAETYREKIVRNSVFNFLLNINSLGGLSPEEAVEPEINFDVLDWTTNQIEVTIKRFDWLIVYEQNIQMYNINEYKIPYTASRPLNLVSNTASYIKYNSSNGTEQTIYYSGGDLASVVFADEISGEEVNYITVTSKIPTNYAPKDINLRFNLKDSDSQLFATVRIKQYPPIYVEGEQSGGTGPGKNIFHVTVMSFDDESLGGFFKNDTYGVYRVGDPTYVASSTYKYRTVEEEWAANTVSPRFMIASDDRFPGGLLDAESYSYAVTYCQNYSEKDYKAGTWRIPTKAELRLIYKLQAAESAIQSVFQTSFYRHRTWAAKTNASGDKYKWLRWDGLNPGMIGTQSGNTPSRFWTCVRDEWIPKSEGN